MNILIAGTNYEPEVTGTGRYTGEMAMWLAARGHEVTAIVAPPHYPEWRISSDYVGRGHFKEQRHGVRVLRTPLYVPPAQKSGAIRRIAMESSYTASASPWWIRQLFASQPPDVIIAVCPPAQIILWPWIMRLFRRVPVLFHIQDLQVDAATRLSMLSGKSFGRLLAFLERASLLAATHVTTISGPMMDRIIAKGAPAERVSVVPNWSSVSAAPAASDVASERERLGVNDDQVLALYSGNLGKKQGVEVLLDTAQKLIDQRHIKLVIAGRGSEEAALKENAKALGLPNLTFSDLVPDSRLAATIAAADIHLVVQKAEAADLVMPSKLTNILAVGRATIVTASGDTELAHVIESSHAGLAVPPGDSESLAQALKDLAGDPGLRARMGENARTYAIQHLGKDVILQSLESLLMSLHSSTKR